MASHALPKFPNEHFVKFLVGSGVPHGTTMKHVLVDRALPDKAASPVLRLVRQGRPCHYDWLWTGAVARFRETLEINTCLIRIRVLMWICTKIKHRNMINHARLASPSTLDSAKENFEQSHSDAYTHDPSNRSASNFSISILRNSSPPVQVRPCWVVFSIFLKLLSQETSLLFSGRYASVLGFNLHHLVWNSCFFSVLGSDVALKVISAVVLRASSASGIPEKGKWWKLWWNMIGTENCLVSATPGQPSRVWSAVRLLAKDLSAELAQLLHGAFFLPGQVNPTPCTVPSLVTSHLLYLY